MAEDPTRTKAPKARAIPPAPRSARQLDQIVLSTLKAGLPYSAYEITRMAAQQGSPLSAMQAYRVLVRLIHRGQVMRIETLNAYALAPEQGSGFVVCRRCRTARTIVLPDREPDMRALCGTVGFSLSTMVVEASGLCAPCLGTLK
ncbi:hypothetical protein [Novosphingobium kaempferiae]|uniref:hypothetical protein n=1 Tax=Novosphingobium kaempferiae TaxID=2896849 RepID=UPI001E4CBF33|nr:hypothetical protein [Novosphingobium kaempferiae]